MGAWSHEPFGNDNACDWGYDLLGSKDFAYIESALDKVLTRGTRYVEKLDGEEAVAAIEVIAKLLGHGTQTDGYTEDIDKWVKKRKTKPPPVLITKAQAVLLRLVEKNSELAEVWKESGDAEWRATISTLLNAISA